LRYDIFLLRALNFIISFPLRKALAFPKRLGRRAAASFLTFAFFSNLLMRESKQMVYLMVLDYNIILLTKHLYIKSKINITL